MNIIWENNMKIKLIVLSKLIPGKKKSQLENSCSYTTYEQRSGTLCFDEVSSTVKVDNSFGFHGFTSLTLSVVADHRPRREFH